MILKIFLIGGHCVVGTFQALLNFCSTVRKNGEQSRYHHIGNRHTANLIRMLHGLAWLRGQEASISRQFACRSFRKGDIGQVWGGFYTEDRQFWRHRCMLDYTDFSPEASVDDDSTKLLSIDILLEETTRSTRLRCSY